MLLQRAQLPNSSNAPSSISPLASANFAGKFSQENTLHMFIEQNR